MVRAGTPLAALDAALAANHQMLGFEPPQRAGCTVGGAVALGWSGPRRPFAGALRDHLLGVRLLDGLGRDLRFGGPVVKNVAGFDVARLMAGSMGILGVLLEVSLRVVPRPVVERTGVIACDPAQALRILQGLRVGPGLLSGAAHAEGRLLLRSSGTPECVLELLERLGAQPLPQEQGEAFWQAFNDQTHMFFVPADEGLRLWRLSVRLDAPALPGPWRQAADWAGALRWVWAPPDAAASLAAWARGHGGHAALWRGATPDERQSGRHIDLPGALRSVHERLADVFDPHHVFNRARLLPARAAA
jgi:glycolate oxidase FAD binding subunit